MPQVEEPEQITMMKRMVALAEEQVTLSTERSRMSADRSRMSADRSEMSEVRSYLNAERTLSVWVRTALATMVLGLAVDRFGLLLGHAPGGGTPPPGRAAALDGLSGWAGAGLVVLGVVMVVATGARFLAYALAWRSRHEPPPHHGPFLAPFFALMVAAFGVLVLVIMAVFRP